MATNDGNGPGDEQRSAKKKRAVSARKRAPKTTESAGQNGASATEREVAPQAQPQPAQTQPNVPDRSAERSAVGTRSPGQRTPGERPANLGNTDGRHFADRDADSAADVAADLKSWMDTRREDSRGEVL